VGRKFGKFGESSLICQIAKLKPFEFLLTTITFWLSLLICQTFFCQMLKMSKFTKLLPCQTFSLCGIIWLNVTDLLEKSQQAPLKMRVLWYVLMIVATLDVEMGTISIRVALKKVLFHIWFIDFTSYEGTYSVAL